MAAVTIAQENLIYNTPLLVQGGPLPQQKISTASTDVFILDNFSEHWMVVNRKYNTAIPDYTVKPWTKRTIVLPDCPDVLYVQPLTAAGTVPGESAYFTQNPYVRYQVTNNAKGIVEGETSYLTHSHVANTITIEPASTASFPVTGNVDATITNSQITITPEAGATFTVAGTVEIASGTVTITGTTDVNITNGTLTIEPASGSTFTIAGTVEIASGTVTLSGTSDVSITNATLTVEPASGTTFTIAGAVDINAGQLVQVENASGGSLTVAGTVTVESGTVTIAGTPDVNVTNATLSIQAASGVTLPISGSVDINAGQLIQVENPSGGSLEIAGAVNATIQNATIDTQSTVVNEQLFDSMDTIYNMSATVQADSTTVDFGIQQILSAPRCLTTNALWLLVTIPSQTQISGIGVSYTLYMTWADGTQTAMATQNLTQTVTSGTIAILPVFPVGDAGQGLAAQPVLFNAIDISLTGLTSATGEYTVNAYVGLPGNTPNVINASQLLAANQSTTSSSANTDGQITITTRAFQHVDITNDGDSAINFAIDQAATGTSGRIILEPGENFSGDLIGTTLHFASAGTSVPFRYVIR